MEVENLPSQTVADQQPKPDRKVFAIASFILGILWTALAALLIIFLISNTAPDSGSSSAPVMAYIGTMIALIFVGLPGLITLILGLIGLRSTKRNFAIGGIILSLLPILWPLYLWLNKSW